MTNVSDMSDDQLAKLEANVRKEKITRELNQIEAKLEARQKVKNFVKDNLEVFAGLVKIMGDARLLEELTSEATEWTWDANVYLEFSMYSDNTLDRLEKLKEKLKNE